jgi:hypothetical protein
MPIPGEDILAHQSEGFIFIQSEKFLFHPENAWFNQSDGAIIFIQSAGVISSQSDGAILVQSWRCRLLVPFTFHLLMILPARIYSWELFWTGRGAAYL